MAEQGAGAVPGVTIDEAVELFLGVSYPHGLPDGADREVIVAALKARIARERPEWAQAYAPRDVPQPDHASYSEVKAAAVEQARQADLPPTDPEERYLYMRRQEAEQNAAARKTDAREAQVRADLIARLTASKQPPAPGEVERVLTIRRELEQRLKLAGPQPTLGGLPLAPPGMGLSPLAQAALHSGMAPVQAEVLAPRLTPGTSRTMALEAVGAGPKPMDPLGTLESLDHAAGRDKPVSHDALKEATAAAFKTMLDARKAQLPKRESLLAPRRPARAQALSTEAARASGGLSLSDDAPAARPQLWPESTRRKSRGLTLE